MKLVNLSLKPLVQGLEIGKCSVQGFGHAVYMKAIHGVKTKNNRID